MFFFQCRICKRNNLVNSCDNSRKFIWLILFTSCKWKLSLYTSTVEKNLKLTFFKEMIIFLLCFPHFYCMLQPGQSPLFSWTCFRVHVYCKSLTFSTTKKLNSIYAYKNNENCVKIDSRFLNLWKYYSKPKSSLRVF